MNLSRIAFIACIVTITGCSSRGDLKKQMPDLNLDSQKAAKTVTGCVADDLEKAFKMSVLTRTTEHGYSVWGESPAFGGKDVSFVVDITDTASGSNTLLYSKVAFWQVDQFKKIIRDCQ
ncbi:MAG: hypothetical protein HY938_10815 [Nitrosomonadales bacterium]|nr:hypothetical protein [Nitrosomonadales bacterium]